MADNRVSILSVRLTLADRRRIEAAAKADQRKVSDWARVKLLEAVRK